MVVTLFGILWSCVNHLWPNAMWQFSKAIHLDKNTKMSTALVCSCRHGLSVKVYFWAQANIKIKHTWKWRQDDKTLFSMFHIGCRIHPIPANQVLPLSSELSEAPADTPCSSWNQSLYEISMEGDLFHHFPEVRWMKSCWFPSWQGAVTVLVCKGTRSQVASSFRTTEFWKKTEVAERLALKPCIRCERRFQ